MQRCGIPGILVWWIPVVPLQKIQRARAHRGESRHSKMSAEGLMYTKGERKIFAQQYFIEKNWEKKKWHSPPEGPLCCRGTIVELITLNSTSTFRLFSDRSWESAALASCLQILRNTVSLFVTLVKRLHFVALSSPISLGVQVAATTKSPLPPATLNSGTKLCPGTPLSDWLLSLFELAVFSL